MHTFTVLVPYVPAPYRTEWHPDSETGPFSVLCRGSFATLDAAIDWARAHLGGTPYTIRVEDAWRNTGGNGSAKAVWCLSNDVRGAEIWDIRAGYCEVVCWQHGTRVRTVYASSVDAGKRIGELFLSEEF